MHKDSSTQNRKFDFSYTLGVSPTLELLHHKREYVKKLYFSTRSSKNQGARELVSLCKKHKIPFEISDKMVGKLSPKENSMVVGLFDKYDTKLSPIRNHIILGGIRDMGNMGGIIRTMAAFGFYDLAIIKPSVHVFDPKVIRASMGELFSVNFEYFEDYDAYLDAFQNHEIISFSSDSKYNPSNIDISAPYAVLFTDDLFSPHGFNGKRFGVKTLGNNPLNVSIAVGISLYELSKHS